MDQTNSSTSRVSTIAPPPFDNQLDKADCILRTADDVDFSVHSLVLSMVSPVFRSMFDVGRTTSTPDDLQEIKDGRPVIQLSEDCSTLQILLRHIYPPPIVLSTIDVERSSFSSETASTLMTLYDAFDKYDVKGYEMCIIDALSPKVSEPEDTLAAYAWACRRRISIVIKAAAMATLHRSLADYPYCPAMESIPASQLQKLIIYRSRCQEEASKLAIRNWEWIGNISDIPLAHKDMAQCQHCRSRCISKNPINGAIASSYGWPFYAAAWWEDYMHKAEYVLKLRPRGHTVTNKDFLAPTLEESQECTRNEECRTATGKMVEFSEKFAAAIERAVSMVDPPLASP